MKHTGAPVPTSAVSPGNYIGSTLAPRVGARIVWIFLLVSFVIAFISLFWKYYIAG